MEDWRKSRVEIRNAEKGTGLGVEVIMISVGGMMSWRH